MKYFIEIFGNSSDILSIRLKDILNCFRNKEDYYWSLLWIDGVITKDNIKKILNFSSVIDLENSINKSKNGLRISIDNLSEIDTSTYQILNLLLIADSNVENLRRFESDDDMYNECSIVIELVDGNYWEICTNNNDFKKKIETLDGAKIKENG